MSLHQAAKSLYNILKSKPWFVTVSEGRHDRKPSLYLYVKNKKHCTFSDEEWEGFHVEVKEMNMCVTLPTK